MRVLVCGGRDFSDVAFVCSYLDDLRKRHIIDMVIEGNARGADRIAGYWARKRGITNLKFPVSPEEWKTWGKAAGVLRNERMLEEGKPDLVIAFPGGRGTAHMVKIARKANIQVIEVTI